MAKTIIFDRVAGNFIITSQTDYSVLSGINLSVPIDGGVEIYLDGVEYYNNSSISSVDYTVASTPNNVTTMVATIPLPKDADGNIVVGEYEISTYDRYTLNAGGTAIYSGDENTFTHSGQVNKAACVNSNYSCVAPSITVYDTTDYDVGIVSPTVESAELVLTYPETSEIAPITATTLPLQIDTATVYTKDYRINEDITLLYDFTDYQERINVLAEGGFSVKCDTLCSVSKCINSFKEEMDAAEGYNDVKYQKMLADYNHIMSISTQVMIENACDGRDNIPALLNEITDIINASSCKTNCSGSCVISGVSERVYGLGNAISGDSLLNTNNGIVFSPQTAEIVFEPDGLNFTSDGTGKVTVESQVKPNNVVSQVYIDTQDNLRVLKAGDTMTGTLNGTDVNLSGTLGAVNGDFTEVDVIGNVSGLTGSFSGLVNVSSLSATSTGNDYASPKGYVITNDLTSQTAKIWLNDGNQLIIQNSSTGARDIFLGRNNSNVFVSGLVKAATSPSAGEDLTNKTYSDSQDALKVSKSGDTMTGTLIGTSVDLSGNINVSDVNASTYTLYDGVSGYDKFAQRDGNDYEIGDASKGITFVATDVPNYQGEQFQTKQGGGSANRPSNPPDFHQYFDTDLNGGKGFLIIYYNGNWLDPTGSPV